jgi:lipoate-protein ligase B
MLEIVFVKMDQKVCYLLVDLSEAQFKSRKSTRILERTLINLIKSKKAFNRSDTNLRVSKHKAAKQITLTSHQYHALSLNNLSSMIKILQYVKTSVAINLNNTT